MANPYRGEVALTFNGERRVMRLSLGALAALEDELESGSLVGLVERFEAGSFSTRDLVALIAAGLGVEKLDVLDGEIAGGPLEAARAAAQLLKVTFAVPEADAT
ncbi:gene transfer agent family protein [Halovulum sp. GXIMD14793]